MGPFAMHTFENGVRGGIALEDIPKDSLIVYVPESQLLTSTQTADSPTLQKLDQLGIELDLSEDTHKNFLMAIYILDESRNPDTKHAHHFRTMP